MANPQKINIVDIDIAQMGGMVHRSSMNRTLGEGDVAGDRIGVRILKNGEAVSLTGCNCSGFFMRPDGNTIVIEGTIEGNKAYVNIPEACYAYTGNYTLSIKVTGTGFAGTMRIIDGTIVDTKTGSFIDPGSVIPDLSDWLALVTSANTAATNIGKIHIENELITGTRYKMKVYKDS